MEGSFSGQAEAARCSLDACGACCSCALAVIDSAAAEALSLIGAYGVGPFVAAIGRAAATPTAVVRPAIVASVVAGSPSTPSAASSSTLARSLTWSSRPGVAIQVASTLRVASEASLRAGARDRPHAGVSPSPEEATR